MKLAILSDTHNDSRALTHCLALLKTRQINIVCHCGDLSSPRMIRLFNGFQVFYSFGNCDYLSGEIKEQFILLGTESRASMLGQFKLNDISMAVVHGHDRNINTLAKSGKFRYIFTGHTHKKKDETIKTCRVINPGSLSTRGYNIGTYAILDLDCNVLEFHSIKY